MSKGIIEIETLEEARELKSKLDKLLDSPAWPFLQEFLEARVSGLETILAGLGYVKTTEQMADFAYKQGQIDELKFFPVMVAQLHADIQEEIRRLVDEATNTESY
jgi:hypothetical protein